MRKGRTTLLGSLYAVALIALTSNTAMAQQFSGPSIPAGWSCLVTNTCGTNYGYTAADNGVVTTGSPSPSSYGWVSTVGGISGASPFPSSSLPSTAQGGIGNTNGTWLRSQAFSAAQNEVLKFQFNYVTSDGGTYSDYAWARLLYAGTQTQADVIFTARTIDWSGATVPGFDLPILGSTALSLSGTPVSSVPIISTGYTVSSTGDNNGLGIGPLWSPLGLTSPGGYNGTCWDVGCGYTGWIDASYTVGATGNYVLEFGVSNWNDEAWDSGMAFDAVTIGTGLPGGDVDIDDDSRHVGAIPEPESYAMLLAGLGLIGFMARRRTQKHAA